MTDNEKRLRLEKLRDEASKATVDVPRLLDRWEENARGLLWKLRRILEWWRGKR